MKRIGLRLFQKKAVQNFAQTSLAASAAVPDSGFAFVNNSQGASAALSEFTTAFSTALNDIDLDGKPRPKRIDYLVPNLLQRMLMEVRLEPN